jgi:hypothetical protein
MDPFLTELCLLALRARLGDCLPTTPRRLGKALCTVCPIIFVPRSLGDKVSFYLRPNLTKILYLSLAQNILLSASFWNNNFRVPTTEYWMIYRGPGFLAVVWFGFSATPSLPCPVRKLSIFLILPVCRRSSLVMREGWEEPNYTTARKSDPL